MKLSLSPEKCEFLMNSRTILGHSISQEGLHVDPNKIAIIKRVPTPQKHRDVRSFLGLDGYSRRFIKEFTRATSPFFGLLAKDSKFLWSESCQEALKTLKEKLTIAHIPQAQIGLFLFIYMMMPLTKAQEQLQARQMTSYLMPFNSSVSICRKPR